MTLNIMLMQRKSKGELKLKKKNMMKRLNVLLKQQSMILIIMNISYGIGIHSTLMLSLINKSQL